MSDHRSTDVTQSRDQEILIIKNINTVYFRSWMRGGAQCVQRREPKDAVDAKSNFTVGKNVKGKTGKCTRKCAQK